MRFAPVKIIISGDMSADIESPGVDLNQIFLYSIQGVWTGSPEGTLKLQVSNDDVDYYGQANAQAQVVNWSDYTGSSTSVSGAGNFLWNVFDVGYRWVRIVYVYSSGTGSLNATYSGKGM